MTLFPCGVQGEFYCPITIGTTEIKALIDTGSGALLAVQNVPNVVTYKKRPQVQELTTANIPLSLSCSLKCTDQSNSACFFAQDKVCELHFGTGDLHYSPVLEKVAVGSMTHNAFFVALADSEENFPFPIGCIMGISHYKYSDDSPLGSLCANSNHAVMINQATTTFQIFQHLGGGNCLIDTQTIRLAYGTKDKSLSFSVPPPLVSHVPMVTSMLPFYAVELTAFQVGSVKVPLTQKQVFILDSGTSSGGSLAPEVYDALGSTLVRYTNGLSGLSINDAKVQGVQKEKLSLFPPISFTWGTFEHVMQPEVYMVPETCGKPNLINIFSRGDGNVSILGNICFQQLALTFELLHDRVYFESLVQPVPTIDRNYPSPANAPGTGLTMAESIGAGESVELPAPKVRLGIPHAVIKKLAAAQPDFNAPLNSFSTVPVNNQCCLYNEDSKKNTDVKTLGLGDALVNAALLNAPLPGTLVWSPRNIALVSLIVVCTGLWIWRLYRLVVFVKKTKKV
jgi:hypothetical protein